MKQVWVKVKQHTNYEVSNYGLVRNIKTGRILIPFRINKSSRLLYVALFNKNVKTTISVHGLVYKHFKGRLLNGFTAAHKNFIQSDNKETNLFKLSKGDAIARTNRFNNKRKYRGVHKWRGKGPNNKWRAMLCVGKMKVKTLGYFRTRKAAHKAYTKAFNRMFFGD